MALILMVHPRGGATIASRPGATDGPWRRQRGTQACFCGVTALGLTSALAKGPPTPRRPWAAGTLASGIALASALAACAHAPVEANARAEYERNNDPAEPTNRTIFACNKFVDDHALQPVARGYEDCVPGRAQKSIHNFVSNLSQPA